MAIAVTKDAHGQINVLMPAGAILSNVDDMLIFLAANMGLIQTRCNRR